MLAHHAMTDFRCRSICKHKECQRHAPLGLIDQNLTCECLGKVNASSIFLENVVDLAKTLARIMMLLGLHECKAKATIDVVTYAFLHYDQVCYSIEAQPKKRLRKEDLFHDLGRTCLLNRVEAHIAYTIIKRGFKAFYHKCNTSHLKESDGRPELSDECAYVHAAKKTARDFADFDGLSCVEQLGFEAKIKGLYREFYERMRDRQGQPAGDSCNCCFCAKRRIHQHIYATTPPCSTRKKTSHKCPQCCRPKKKKKFVRTVPATCPVCHRSRRYCTCEKYQFELDYVKSIWERPDFERYREDKLEGPFTPPNTQPFAPFIPAEGMRISRTQGTPKSSFSMRNNTPNEYEPRNLLAEMEMNKGADFSPA